MSGPRKSRGGGDLGEDEAALWDYVTRNVRPTGAKQRVVVRPATIDDYPPRPTPQPAPEAQHKKSQARATPKAPAVREPEPVRPVVLERRKARRIARGTEDIEAKLDLHGMTQDQAHGALLHFIRRCQAAEMRTVLVVTGKGSPRGGDHDGDGWRAKERGVLKRMVPHWLDGPELRPLVIGYTSAHVRHGGAGAMYVTLRKRG